MVRPLKHLKIQNLQEVIKETAWQQIAQLGAPALSLRAIARTLQITAPAIYNYFPHRDALVTALIIDAYTSFGDSQIAARDAQPPHNLTARLTATGMAYRAWALSHPHHYQLIFGTPIPGYQPPAEQILPAGTRSLSALASIIQQAHSQGRLISAGIPAIQPHFQPLQQYWLGQLGISNPNVLTIAMLIWARVHGLVSLEISGALPCFGEDGSALYQLELTTIHNQFITEQA